MNIASCSGDDKQPIGMTQDNCKYDHNGVTYFSGQCEINIVNPPGEDFCYHGFNIGGDFFFAS